MCNEPERKTDELPVVEFRPLAALNNDRLDAIATHAGSLWAVVRWMDDDEVMPFFTEELERLERLACDELQRRGVIQRFDEYDEAS